MEKKLSERKEKILKAVVDEYIQSALPVSSGEIKSKHFSEISSATIRAEMSTLEDMGYLVQPHTSAGRVPAPKAYQLYVERFADRQSLAPRDIEIIERSFDNKFAEMSELVKTTAKVISDVTNYTSVIVMNNITKVKLKEIKLVELDAHTALVIIITDSGIIRDKVISVKHTLTENDVKNANILLNNAFSGKTVGEAQYPEELISNELEAVRELYENIVRILEQYAKGGEEDVVLEGANKLLSYRHTDKESAENFLTVLESKEKLQEVIDDDSDIEFSVKIGKDETGGLEKCAIVTARYKVSGKEIGHAGVIGPERMNYNKVMSVLRYVGKTLDYVIEAPDKGGKTDD